MDLTVHRLIVPSQYLPTITIVAAPILALSFILLALAPGTQVVTAVPDCGAAVEFDNQWANGYRLICQHGVYVLMVDLTNPAVKVEVVAAGSGTPALSSSTYVDGNTIAVINADYQWCASGAICSQGLTISNGSNPTTFTNIEHLCKDALVRREIGFSRDGQVTIDWWYRFVSDSQARNWCNQYGKTLPGTGGGAEQYSYNLVGGGPQFTFDGSFQWDCQYGRDPVTLNCKDSAGDVGINGEHFAVGDWWNRPQSVVGYTTDGTVLLIAESVNAATMQSMHDVMYQRASAYGKTLRNSFKFDGGSKAGFWYVNQTYSIRSYVAVPNALRVRRVAQPPCTSTPNLVSPGDGQTINNRTVTFSWNPPSSCSPDGYTFRISRDGNPENYIFDTGVGPTSYTYTFSQDGTFYWHVRACKPCTPYQPGPWASRTVAISTTPPPSGWQATYFRRNDLSDPVFSQQEDTGRYLFWDWGSGSPRGDVPADNFSAEWAKDVDFAGGDYMFFANHDDGLRICVDGCGGSDDPIDNWNGGGKDQATRNLSGAKHRVIVQYREFSGEAHAEVWWEGPGETRPHEARDPNRWFVQYFPNKRVDSPSMVEVNESADFINHEWQENSPGWGLPADHFSLRAEKTLNVGAGQYRFHIVVDDGGRLWVDNNLIINQWRDQGPTEYTADVNLAAGAHTVKFEYYENGGGATARFWWEQLSTPTPQPSFTTSATVFPTAVQGGAKVGV